MEETSGDEKQKLSELRQVEARISKRRTDASKSFPLFFTMLTAFGVVITYNGIHGLTQKVDWLNRNPVITLAVGVLILLFTGTLYKKL